MNLRLSAVEMPDVRQLLAQARELLTADTARLDAEVLLGHVTGLGRAQIYANPDRSITEKDARVYLELIHRRGGGEPVAYLTGVREFWSLSLHVTPEVLIPRPETELLVETALEFIPPHKRWRIADLGTGSGAVALAIALERPQCEVHATEIDSAALKIAQENASLLAPGQIRLHAGSWLEPLQGEFHLIVSNPPYINSGDPHLSRGDVRFEPVEALSPGEDGLAAIRLIVANATRYLTAGGILAFEHGHDQGCEARTLLEHLDYGNIETRKDLAGQERVSIGTLAKKPD